MLVFDGNNSLKRMKTAHRQREVGDVCELTDSDYFFDNVYINSFEDEVWHPTQTCIKEELKDEIVNGDDGYSIEANDPQLEDCASNWKAAASMEKKRMWGIFDETGTFASACPHGFVLWLADMVQSGEQYVHIYCLVSYYPDLSSHCRAKYPLSMVAKAMDTLGSNLQIGYDIGCVFGRTILSSSLGDQF